MATSTANYGFVKPGMDENADISVINGDLDEIDRVIKTVADGIDSGKDFQVSISATSATSYTYSDNRITADHQVRQESTDHSADITWTTAEGSLTLACSAGIPAMVLTLFLPLDNA